MEQPFLVRYFDAFHTIQGWFSFDAALMFMAYSQLLADRGIAGDVLEIGVHQGLSAITVGSLRGPGRTFHAVDLFEELQERNVSGSGGGSKVLFLRNMQEFFPDSDFIRTVTQSSADLTPADFGGSQFSFCHIDGGHSARETFRDLDLSAALSMPGGLIALDDYFNPQFPGVCEGAVEFMLSRSGMLKPIAIGYNKVIFQRMPAPFDLRQTFAETYPQIPLETSELWGETATRFAGPPLRKFFDLRASTPVRLVTHDPSLQRALIEPSTPSLTGRSGATLTLQVAVTNQSSNPFPCGDRVFGLSYHLLSEEGSMLVVDNPRSYFLRQLEPGGRLDVELPVTMPEAAGNYRVELDLVWEGVGWFKESGNPTVVFPLTVTEGSHAS